MGTICESKRRNAKSPDHESSQIYHYYGPTIDNNNNNQNNIKRSITPENIRQNTVENPFKDNTVSQINYDINFYNNNKSNALTSQNLKNNFNYRDPLISTSNFKNYFPNANNSVIKYSIYNNSNQKNLISNSNIKMQNNAFNSQQINLIPVSFVHHSAVDNNIANSAVKNSNIQNNNLISPSIQQSLISKSNINNNLVNSNFNNENIPLTKTIINPSLVKNKDLYISGMENNSIIQPNLLLDAPYTQSFKGNRESTPGIYNSIANVNQSHLNSLMDKNILNSKKIAQSQIPNNLNKNNLFLSNTKNNSVIPNNKNSINPYNFQNSQISNANVVNSNIFNSNINQQNEYQIANPFSKDVVDSMNLNDNISESFKNPSLLEFPMPDKLMNSGIQQSAVFNVNTNKQMNSINNKFFIGNDEIGNSIISDNPYSLDLVHKKE